VVLSPSQINKVPPIAAGMEFTVTVTERKHPVDKLYDILAVPAATPLTVPLVPTEATVALLLLHVPPDVPDESDTYPLSHIDSVPVIEAGRALTV
jgi:hypothetical protein